MIKKYDIPKDATMYTVDQRGEVIFLKLEDDVLMVYSNYIGWEQADEEFFE